MTRAISSIFFWFCLLIIPLSFNFWGLDPALYSKFLLLDLSLGAASIYLIIKAKGVFKINSPVLMFALCYGLYIFLSVISLAEFSINRADGWFVWLHLFTLPIFVLLLILSDGITEIRRDEVSFIISCMAGCSITIGVFQYGTEVHSEGWSMAASDAMRSTYAHKNIFAEVMLLTLPFSLYTGMGSGWRRWPGIFISVATVCVIALLMSRAVWLGLAAALSVTSAVYAIATGKWRPRWYHAFGILAVLISCYLIYQYFIWHTNTGDYMAYFYSKRDTVNERKHLWTTTWEIIKLHPLWGSGLGSWKVLNMRYGIVGLRNYVTFFQQPHNDSLWVISEQGIAAFLAVIAAWAFIVYSLLKQILARPADLFLYCLLFALTGYGFYANLAFPKERAEHAIIITFIAFFILSRIPGKSYSIPYFVTWAICFILAAGAWWSGQKMIAEIHLRRYFEARSINNTEEQRIQLSAISPNYFSLDGTATPIAWYRGMLNFSQGNNSDALTDFKEAVAANPYHVYSLCNVGTCLSIYGDKAGAEKYFMQALEYSPGFPDAALNLCAIRNNEGRTDSAAMYLGMMNIDMTNIRYVKSMNVVMRAVTRPILDSLMMDQDSVFKKKIKILLNTPDWQKKKKKKAYLHQVKPENQVLLDIIWTIRNRDKDSITASEYLKRFKLPAL